MEDVIILPIKCVWVCLCKGQSSSKGHGEDTHYIMGSTPGSGDCLHLYRLQSPPLTMCFLTLLSLWRSVLGTINGPLCFIACSPGVFHHSLSHPPACSQSVSQLTGCCGLAVTVLDLADFWVTCFSWPSLIHFLVNDYSNVFEQYLVNCVRGEKHPFHVFHFLTAVISVTLYFLLIHMMMFRRHKVKATEVKD